MSRLLAWLRGSQFLRYALVGSAGFIVNETTLFVALNALHLGRYAGAIFSFLVTVTFTWWGNRMLTFRAEAASGDEAMLVEWAKFVAANGVGFAVNYATYAAIITFAPAPANNPYFALACGTLAGLIFNFTLSKRLVFTKFPPAP
jgi:putative flippase GtrA